MRASKAERMAVADVLEAGAEGPDQLADLAIDAYYQATAYRIPSFALLTTGGVYQVVGPFSTAGQASRFIEKSGAEKGWVLLGRTEEGWMKHLAEKVDVPAEPKGDFAVLKEDAKAFKNGWNGVNAQKAKFLTEGAW